MFNKKQWEKCCEYREFMDAVMEDLPKAHRLAIQILNGRYEESE